MANTKTFVKKPSGKDNNSSFKRELNFDRKIVKSSILGKINEIDTIDYCGRRNPVLYDSLKKNLEIYTAKHYGFEVAHLFKTGEIFEFEPLQQYQAEDLDEDPMLKIMFVEECKNRAKEKLNFTRNCKQVYTLIKGQCTISMWNRIKQTADFEEFDKALNIKKLWERITELLLVAVGENQNEKKVKILAKAQFENMKQYTNESLNEFYERFKIEIESQKASGNIVGDDADIAMYFLNKLDPNRYGTLNVHLDNRMLIGHDEYPSNLSDALVLAQNWIVAVPRYDYYGNSANVAFYTTEQKIAKVNKFNENKNYERKNNNFTQKKHIPNFKKQFDNSEKAAKKTQEFKGKKSDGSHKCWTCGSPDHFRSNCPQLKEVMEEEGVNCIFDITTNNVLATMRQPLSDMEILLDNQATISIFKNKNLLTNIRSISKPILVNGISGVQIKVNQVGDYDWYGEVYYSPNVSANVLCYYDVAQSFPVVYNDDTFTVNISPYESPKVFVPKNKLYILVEQNVKDNYVGQESIFLNTVENNEMLFSRSQVEAAKKVKDVIQNLGYPSKADLKNSINTGGIKNFDITAKDVDNYYTIYGNPIAEIKGKTVSKKPMIVNADQQSDSQIVMKSNVTLNVDIMFVDKHPYLISVTEVLGLLMVSALKSRTSANMKVSIEAIINKHIEAGFKIDYIKSDNEGGLTQLQSYLKIKYGINVNIVSREQHVPLIERKIRQVKERMRCIMSEIPYKIPKKVLDYLVSYAVKCINCMPTKHNNLNVNPYELFTGRKLDIKKDFPIPFGQRVHIGKDDSVLKKSVDISRTVDAISLIAKDNIQRTMLFYVLNTQLIVTRNYWQVIPINQDFINSMNFIADTTGNGIDAVGIDKVIYKNNIIIENDLNNNNIIDNENINLRRMPTNDNHVHSNYPGVDESNNIMIEITNAENINNFKNDLMNNNISEEESQFNKEDEMKNNQFNVTNDNNLQIITNNNNDNINLNETENINNLPSNLSESTSNSNATLLETNLSNLPNNDLNNNFEKINTTISEILRLKKSVAINSIDSKNKKSDKNKVVSNYNLRDGIKVHEVKDVDDNNEFVAITIQQQVHSMGKKGLKALVKELKQLKDKDVFEPIHLYKLMERANFSKKSILSMKTFLKEKRDLSIKGRAVAGGHRQNKKVYDVLKELNSNTVKHESILIIFCIAISEHRIIVTADIVGAYLNALIEKDVYMKFDVYESELLCKMYPEFLQFMNADDNCLYVKLKKALYGCIESAKLFYLHLRKILIEYGFSVNPYDECVFNFVDNDSNVITVATHVDDLLITCTNESTLSKFTEYIKNSFYDVKFNYGNKHQYLGVNVLYDTDYIEFDMKTELQKIANDYKNVKLSKIPADNDFFKISSNEFLGSENIEKFHSFVAKLLYVARMCRPDILAYVSYLTTRVNKPTVNDEYKLRKLLGYLLYSIDITYRIDKNVFNSDGSIDVNCFIDSSHGLHDDLRGQTGIVIKLGSATIFARSAKQKLNTKSSTETELHGVAEEVSQAIWTKNWLESMNHKVRIINLHLDNKSTIIMLLTGKCIGRNTRHINMRTFFIKQFIDDNTIKLVFTPTDKLFVDLLSKQMQGKKLIEFTNVLMHK